ncbi:MAG: polysaccharide biosynthesis/export family protein [Azonexus sp.]
MNIVNIKVLVVGAICLAASLANAQSNDPFFLRKSLGLSQAPMQEANTASYIVKSDQVPPASTVTHKTPTSVAGDHAANSVSDVFGANLFTGAFAKQGPGRFNPDYAVMVGDRIQLRLWGGFQFDGIVEVDSKGNIFLPHVGPVMVLGVRNEELQRVVEGSVRRIFRANVYSYASLAAAQPVRVFVGGFVNRPGLYNGTSMDSLLSYLDQAGGIDVERGSFLNVEVKRGDRLRASVDLYEFLLQGRIPLVQLAEGDVIFVSQRQSTVKVSGLVGSANRFEFSSQSRTVADLIKVARPKPQATHVRVVRNAGATTNTDYLLLEQAGQLVLQNGDEIEFTADKKLGTITVRVEGEHQSPQEYVLPYGTRYGELMGRIQYSDRSDSEKPQLFRQSVKARQKQLLSVSLKTLESAVLTARAGTTNEAALRTEEANLILRWVERAKQIEPAGQIVISQSSQRNDLLLENGDIIKIHTKDGLVLIGGEVLFPNAIAYDKRYGLDDYIKVAGGYTQNADTSRIVVAHRDGSFEEGKNADVVAGDEVLVLPKVDVKSREIAKDLAQILYQIAIAAKVALGL